MAATPPSFERVPLWHDAMWCEMQILFFSVAGNKKGRWRAGLLALALGGLLADSSLDVPKELSEYLQLAREQSIKQLQLCPGKLDTCGKLEEGRGPKECKDWIEEEDWLPESGSWVWWLDQQTLAVLCEDLGAQVFAGAKQWLLEAMGGADCTEEDGKAAFGWQIKKVFPDIFWYPTLFKHQESNYQARNTSSTKTFHNLLYLLHFTCLLISDVISYQL